MEAVTDTSASNSASIAPSKGVYFAWNERCNYLLGREVENVQGHLKTGKGLGGDTMEVKWLTILTRLKAMDEFKDLNVKPETLKQRYNENMKDVLKK